MRLDFVIELGALTAFLRVARSTKKIYPTTTAKSITMAPGRTESPAEQVAGSESPLKGIRNLQILCHASR